MKLDKLPKYLTNQLKRLTFPVIITFDDKYPFMHYAEDLKELGRVFVHVVSERLESCFYEDKPYYPAGHKILTLEEIEKLPPQYKELAMKEYKARTERVAEVEENNRIHKLAFEAVGESSPEKAWECLYSHQGGEYESFTITSVEDLRV